MRSEEFGFRKTRRCKKALSIATALALLIGQVLPAAPLSFGEEAALDPAFHTLVPVKSYEAPVSSEPDGLKAPIAGPEEEIATEESPLSEPTLEDSEEEVRDLAEYSFEEALDYLTPDYAAAVIVKSLSGKDLEKLTQLSIEVGIAVIDKKIVLFTSGSDEEIRLLPAAQELLGHASLIAHTHPASESPWPSHSDFGQAGEATEYLVTAQGVYAFNQKGMTSGETFDFRVLAQKLDELSDRESSSKETRDLLNRFIQSVDEYNKNSTESLLFRAGHTTVSPSLTLTPEDITLLPGNPSVAMVAPGASPSTVGGTQRGIQINYDTTAITWVGGGFDFGVATKDLSFFSELRFGLQGDVAQVKFEIVDDQNQKHSVRLIGIEAGQEKVWVIPTDDLLGVNLARVRFIYFIIEGAGQVGTLLVNRIPSSPLVIPPSITHTTADITLFDDPVGNSVVAPQGNPTTVAAQPRGALISYDTNVGGWAGGGFVFDDYLTVPVETQDLSEFSELVFGLKGDANAVKFEIVDDQNRKASVQLVDLSPTQEQVWAIPVSLLQGVDLTRVAYLYFIVEGGGQVGNLEVYRIPSLNGNPVIGPSPVLTVTDITPLPESQIAGTSFPEITLVQPQGAGGSTIADTARGFQFNYDTTTGPWVGGGLTFDHFGTVPIESANFMDYSHLVFGIRGDVPQVKLEIIDSWGQKRAIFLTGIRPDVEQLYSIPGSVFKQGANAFEVRIIYFIAEEAGKTGTLYVNRIPVSPAEAASIFQAPSHTDYEFLTFSDPSRTNQSEVWLRNKITGEVSFLFELNYGETGGSYDVDPSGKYALMSRTIPGSITGARETLAFDIASKQFMKPVNVQSGQPIDILYGSPQPSFGATPYQFLGGVAIYNAGNPKGKERGIFINLNGPVPVLWETQPYATLGDFPVMDINRGTAFSPQLVLNDTRILFYAWNTNGRYLGRYDVATAAVNLELLPFLARGPSSEFVLKAVSPDGRFAIFRDAWDFIYAVDYENINRPVQYFQIPGLDPSDRGTLFCSVADCRLETATFLDSNTVEAILTNGERFLLHIDGSDFRILEGPRVVQASNTLTPRDITPIPAGFQIVDRSPQNPSQVSGTSRGFVLNYDTTTPGYSGGVIQYATPADFSGLTNLVLGLKGDVSQAILEIWSNNGTARAAIYLTGISATQETVFSIPIALLSLLGIDVAGISELRFMVEGPHQEGPNRQGILGVNFVPQTRFTRPIPRTSRPIPQYRRDPQTSEPVTLISAVWHYETILETRSAPNNSSYNFYFYEIGDSETGVTHELRLKNEVTGEVYSLGEAASAEALHVLDVDPAGKFAFVNLKDSSISQGGTLRIYDLTKQAFVQPVDPMTGQAGDLLGLIEGGLRFTQNFAFFNYKDDFSSSFQPKKGIVLNLAVDGIRMTRSIAIKTDQPIVFTPPGDKILFTGLDPYSDYYTHWGIYDIATGKLETVQVGHRAGNDPIMAVSPDGRFAIVDHRENEEIYAFEIRGNAQVFINRVPASLESVRFLTNDLFEVTLTSGQTLYYTVPLTPTVYPPDEFTQEDLITLIKSDLLKDREVYVQGLETGHPDIVAAIATEPDPMQHIYIYSTTGEQLLYVTVQDWRLDPFLSLTIDDTGKVAIIQFDNRRSDAFLGPLPGSVALYTLGEDNEPELVRPAFKDTVTIDDPSGSALNLTIYPNGDRNLPGGTRLVLDVEDSGEITLLEENPNYLPPGVLASLPSSVSNPHFKISIRITSAGLVRQSMFDLWSEEGGYVFSVPADVNYSFASSVSSDQSLALPDVSPDGKTLLRAYASWCTRSSSGCVTKLYVDVYAIGTKSPLKSILLRDMLVDRSQDGVTSVQFVPGSSRFFSVKYQSGKEEIYSLDGTKWVRAASNPNFAFGIEDVIIQGFVGPTPVTIKNQILKLVNLVTGEIVELARTQTRPSLTTSILDARDVDPSGQFVIFEMSAADANRRDHNIHIRNIQNPADQLEIKEDFPIDQKKIDSIEFFEGSAIIKTRATYESGTVIGTTYTVPLQAGSLQVAQKALALIAAGQDFTIQGLLAVQPDYTPVVVGHFLKIYDISQGLDHLVELQTVPMGTISKGQFTFVDIHLSPNGREIVSAGLDGPTANLSVVIDPRTGEELRLEEGAITAAEYKGNLASFTLLVEDGTTQKLCVNLTTLQSTVCGLLERPLPRPVRELVPTVHFTDLITALVKNFLGSYFSLGESETSRKKRKKIFH
jgi:ribosomal protein S28E/S33